MDFQYDEHILTSKDGYVVRKPLVVQPCELGSPFILTTKLGGRIIMMVMPTKLSYGNVTLAKAREGKNMYDMDKLPQFVHRMNQQINEMAGNNIHAKQQHFGYSSNNQIEGPPIHTILTKEEVNHTTGRLVYAVKLFREISGQEKKADEYEVIRKIGKVMQKHPATNNLEENIELQMLIWKNAHYASILLEEIAPYLT